MKNNFTNLLAILIASISAGVLAVMLILPDNFNSYVSAFIPNIYQDITGKSIQVQSLGQSRLISINYQAVNVPKSADIEIVSSDGLAIYDVSNVNLDQRISYSFNTDMTDGSYILRVSSPTIKTKIMPFEIGNDKSDITINLGTFNIVSSEYSVSDINNDGVINTIDMQLMLSGK